MNIKSTFQIYLFFLIGLFVFGCKNKKEVDVSNINLDIKIERFDKDLSSLSPQNFQNQVPTLQKKYGIFYQDFMDGMLGVGNTSSREYYQNLKTVLSAPDYNALKKEVSEKFPDLEKHEEKDRQFTLMDKVLKKLGEPCKTIIEDYYLHSRSMQEICEKFGYTNADNAKTQKYKCLQRLKKLFFQS